MLKTKLNFWQRRKLAKYCKTLIREENPDFYCDAMELLAEGKDIENVILCVYAVAVKRGMKLGE